jgi:hypothetical protein
MENKIIKLINPKVVMLKINLKTERLTKRLTTKKLKHPTLMIYACIELSESLSYGCVYQDEYSQSWYVTGKRDNLCVITNVNQFASFFKMPTELVYAYCPAPMNSSAQPQGEIIYLKSKEAEDGKQI